MYNTKENTITISKAIKVTDDDLIDIMTSIEEVEDDIDRNN